MSNKHLRRVLAEKEDPTNLPDLESESEEIDDTPPKKPAGNKFALLELSSEDSDQGDIAANNFKNSDSQKNNQSKNKKKNNKKKKAKKLEPEEEDAILEAAVKGRFNV